MHRIYKAGGFGTLLYSEGEYYHYFSDPFPSIISHLKPENNRYKNPFGTEIALFRTNEGGMARMAVSWDTPGFGAEAGRVHGQRGSYYQNYEGLEENLPDLNRPPLTPGVSPGGHGGSHGRLTDEFVSSIIHDRKPCYRYCKSEKNYIILACI